MAAVALAWLPGLAAAATQFSYSLDGEYTTSAAIYDQWGGLVKTLWRAQKRGPGTHTVSWDNLDRDNRPVPPTWVTSTDDVTGEQTTEPRTYEIRVLRHNITYTWEGVIGNTSAEFEGPTVFRSYGPPKTLAIAGDTVYFALGYNEQQRGGYAFSVYAPQGVTLPLDSSPASPSPSYRASRGRDQFISLDMVATDGQRLFWVNGGNGMKTLPLEQTRNFVLASDIARRDYAPFPSGSNVCLNYTAAGRNDDGSVKPIPANYAGEGPLCHADQYYEGVIDIGTDPRHQATGIAVQTQGQLLAVAHGVQGEVRLFDKASGATLGSFAIPPTSFNLQSNQLAMAPNGDLWVIVGTTVRRYTDLGTSPRLAASASGFSRPLAVAVHPLNDNLVYVADGGSSQQVKGLDREGNATGWVFGLGPSSDPQVLPNRLSFAHHYSNMTDGSVHPPEHNYALTEIAGLAVHADGQIWVTDAGHGRILQVNTAGQMLREIAYRPGSYIATVDPSNPRRVFSNFLEYEVDTEEALIPGAYGDWARWRLVRNWQPGLPDAQAAGTNYVWAGFRTVTTLRNGRTYAIANDKLFELPASGPARDTGITLASACPQAVGNCVLYENGDLGYHIGPFNRQGGLVYPERGPDGQTQLVYRRRLLTFSAIGNPQWGVPEITALMPAAAPYPFVHNVHSFVLGPRFPKTKSNYVVFFDPGVGCKRDDPQHPCPTSYINEGYHLGAYKGGNYWVESPSAPLNGEGAFQTWQVEKDYLYSNPVQMANDPNRNGSVNYGGNNVWAVDEHVVYGYHGEGFLDLSMHCLGCRNGQANQYMHFHEEGLFIGQFGKPLIVGHPDSEFAGAERAGNAMSNILVRKDANTLYWYHNDESAHAGVHRWRIDNTGSIRVLSGSGVLDSSVVLQPRP